MRFEINSLIDCHNHDWDDDEEEYIDGDKLESYKIPNLIKEQTGYKTFVTLDNEVKEPKYTYFIDIKDSEQFKDICKATKCRLIINGFTETPIITIYDDWAE